MLPPEPGGAKRLVQSKLSFIGRASTASENSAPQLPNAEARQGDTQKQPDEVVAPLPQPPLPPAAINGKAPAEVTAASTRPESALPEPPVTATVRDAEPASAPNLFPPPEAPVFPTVGKDGLSAYERERLANIERNEQVLRELGLLDAPALVQPPPRHAAPRKATRARPTPPPPPTRTLRTRSSSGAAVTSDAHPKKKSRLHDGTGGSAAAANGEEEEEEEEEEEADEEEEDDAYEDSSVFSYTCIAGEASAAGSKSVFAAAAAAAARGGGDSSVLTQGWRSTGYSATFPSRAVYSLDALLAGRAPLLACAGSEGFVSVYPLERSSSRGPTAGEEEEEEEEEEEVEPLQMFKAHTGWIGDVQFASSSSREDGLLRLLTCSNDKTCAIATWTCPPCPPRAQPPSMAVT
jgi:hypothetical protein